jgi:hypothetical protein
MLSVCAEHCNFTKSTTARAHTHTHTHTRSHTNARTLARIYAHPYILAQIHTHTTAMNSIPLYDDISTKHLLKIVEGLVLGQLFS